MTNKTKKSRVQKKKSNRRTSNEPQGVKVAQAIVRVTKGLFIGGAGTFCIWLVLWIYTSLTMHPYLEIKSIEVRGNKRLTVEEVVMLSEIENGMNVITVDVDVTKKNIQTNGFIKDVAVKRILPDKVVIDIEEFDPMALVMTKGLYVMDSSGEIFKKLSPTDKLDLPVITGLENITRDSSVSEESLKTMAIEFIEVAGNSIGLKLNEISELHVDSLYGVTVYTLRDGTRLDMGVGSYGEKIKNLKKFLDSREKGFRGIKSVDLDNARGVIVNFKEGSNNEA